MSEGVSLEVADGIATITIDRPERRNALSIAVSNGLGAIWEQLDASNDVRAAILTSTDCGTFCAGLDLKEAARVEAETGENVLSQMDDPFQRRMRRVRVPIVAAMTGHVFAGGTMLCLGSDLRVGLAGTRIGITEARLGRGAPWAVPLLWMLPQALLMELVVTGEPQPIERFRDLGFVSYVEPDPDAVRARARALAETIRDNAPLSVAAGKASILEAMSLGCDEGLRRADELHERVYASEDAREGPRAFAEKREPRWKGR